MSQGLEDVSGLLELAVEADDEETFNEAVAELDALEEKLAQLEFRRMFSGEYDSADCYLDIQAGSGGTEAQDWASMLSACICAGQKRAALRPKSSKNPKVKWRVSNP
jgi:peptide chain release factor 2